MLEKRDVLIDDQLFLFEMERRGKVLADRLEHLTALRSESVAMIAQIDEEWGELVRQVDHFKGLIADFRRDRLSQTIVKAKGEK